jgi:hypothetical protein
VRFIAAAGKARAVSVAENFDQAGDFDQAGAAAPMAAEAVAAATAALGRPLTQPVEMPGGGDWSAVLRCHDSAGGTVIVKAYPATTEGTSSFAAEAAGLEIASGTGLSPDLLAVDEHRRTLVMADLGTGGSLADTLLGDSAAAAHSALLAWAAACGQLSVAAQGRRAAFEAAQARYLAGRRDERHGVGLPGRVLAAAVQAAKIGVSAPAGLDGELAQIVAAVTASRHAVFSPGDVCPDNNLLTIDGIRFIDFEEAGFHSAFLDAAYIRMPFSTCWCVFRFPPGLSAAAEEAYRTQACLAWPDLADDAIWAPGMRLAVAAWTLSSTSWLLRRSLSGDVPMNPELESPHTRQLVRYRWQALAAELEPTGELPAVAELMRSLLAATTGWRAPELPLYPAFRDR